MIVSFVASESNNTLTGFDQEFFTVVADYIEMDHGVCEICQVEDVFSDDDLELALRLFVKCSDVIEIKDKPSKYDVISKISVLEAERLHIKDES